MMDYCFLCAQRKGKNQWDSVGGGGQQVKSFPTCNTIQSHECTSEGGTSFTVVDSTNLPICYNRSGAEVIVHVSFLADCLTEFSQLLECQLERFRYLVDWLDGLNGEWLVDVCLRIKRLKSRLSAHKVLQLSKTAADSGTIAFDFSILSACTEFQSVPIQCSQLRDFLVRSTK
jgi:hypothetical protein